MERASTSKPKTTSGTKTNESQYYGIAKGTKAINRPKK